MQVGPFVHGVRVLATPRLVIATSVSTLFFLALLLPRAAECRFLPLPLPDQAMLARIDRAEQERFALARDEGVSAPRLSVGVRTVGELFRRAGVLLAAHSPEARDAVAEVRRQFRAEVELGKTSELLALRSLQSQLFVRALTGHPDQARRELEELGGELAGLMDRGWVPAGQRGKIDPTTLRLLFRVRWGHLVGCHREAPFRPSLDEQRAYYATYLLHPPRGDDEAGRALERVRYAQALGQADPEFPVDLAVGMLHLEAGQRELALPALRAHLERSPGGAFANLARNYLLFAASEP